MAQDSQAALFEERDETNSGSVECLGMTFESDQARREYFSERLREKLQDPEFRSTPGFPAASDEAILRLSDPPYYTACPNPFLREFVAEVGEEYSPDESYHREPFAVDVSVGKYDRLYQAHSYHTKVPHLAIAPSILHYTKPGDVVLDAFAGSGMTGVAAQWCGTAPDEYRKELEREWKEEGWGNPEWGMRHAVVGDLSPVASFIAGNYNLPFDWEEFRERAEKLLAKVEEEVGWMYETRHEEGEGMGRINFTVWSQVFTCPECTGEVIFVEEALDPETKKTRKEFPCPSCGAMLSKSQMDRSLETRADPASGDTRKVIRLKPVLINYDHEGETYEKRLDERDEAILNRVRERSVPEELPTEPFPIEEMYHGSRLAPKGFTHIHHLFLPRQAQSLGSLWRHAQDEEDTRLRNMLLFFVEQAIWGMSLLNRYAPRHFSQVNRYLNGVFYVASQISEVSPWYILSGKLKRLGHAFASEPTIREAAMVTTGDCAELAVPSESVDYIFTDPPFGDNIYYADLNFLLESWHGVLTDPGPEAIVDDAKDKGTHEYQQLMRACFEEYHRVLKPGRWMTVVFSNSSNAIWRAIQEAMGTAGFVVADVRTLDKQQGSYRQVTSSAVKQDLVISAYRPSEDLERRVELDEVSEEAVWHFITEHLRHVPVFVRSGQEVEVVSERTSQMLYDRMIAFHVQRGVAVPIGGPAFFRGLSERYPERDGMYFLPGQVAEYDKKRMKAQALKQMELFVTDEASAIQWVRQELQSKPQTFQDLQPRFMKEAQQAWAEHEQTVELREILEQNFLRFDGRGPVPSQIHSYLSSNYKKLRGLEKDDPGLVEAASGRWYVPDPNKQGDLEKLREKALLKEFEGYKSAKGKLREFRTEAVRAGFKDAYDQQDYRTIVEVADRIPNQVLQEDEKLLMYYDVASMRLE